VPVFEQAPKGNGAILNAVCPGGYTRGPAAVTGLHWAFGRMLTWVMPTVAVAVAPLARVTRCGVKL
jgi:hypothetical protein